MRLPFLELPGDAAPVARPVVGVEVEDAYGMPILCLLDTGALGNRFGVEVAVLAGVPLDDPLAETEIAIGGVRTTGRCVRVDLTVAGHRYEAPVWFCDPWPFGFGVLGQEGFFRFFRVTICAAAGWVECIPEPDEESSLV